MNWNGKSWQRTPLEQDAYGSKMEILLVLLSAVSMKFVFAFNSVLDLLWSDLSHQLYKSHRTRSGRLFLFFPLVLCVFNMTLLHRGGLMRSARFDSFTSPAGRITACPITPRACWGSLGGSSPRLWPTLDPWWCTAGLWAWKRSSPSPVSALSINVWIFVCKRSCSSFLVQFSEDRPESQFM